MLKIKTRDQEIPGFRAEGSPSVSTLDIVLEETLCGRVNLIMVRALNFNNFFWVLLEHILAAPVKPEIVLLF